MNKRIAKKIVKGCSCYFYPDGSWARLSHAQFCDAKEVARRWPAKNWAQYDKAAKKARGKWSPFRIAFTAFSTARVYENEFSTLFHEAQAKSFSMSALVPLDWKRPGHIMGRGFTADQMYAYDQQYQQQPLPREDLCTCGHPAEDHRENPKGYQSRLGRLYCRGERTREECPCTEYRPREEAP